MRSTIIFYPTTLKKRAKNGRIPIYLRVHHNNEKAEARLNEEISQEDHLKWNQMSMRLDDITVRNNGNDIPQKIVDKIFQPFFTTKPTVQGTGLGLSLSYDIVKAHGGEIKVSPKESEGSEFII